jgi:energy-coupling factor transporter ATP-binding protein EcfA2
VRLHRIELRAVAGVDHQIVELADQGVTLVLGPNEAGKSTLLRAVDALFDLPDSSTSKQIVNLRAAGSADGPEVCCELTVGGQRLRYRKRWLVRSSTELTEIDPAGGTLTGRQAHDAMTHRLSHEVDLVLWRALRLHQDSPLDSPSLQGSLSLGRALEASGTALPSTTDSTVVKLAVEERERYFTDKRKQPAGELRAAIERDEQAETAARAAAGAVAAAERAIEALADLEARRSSLHVEQAQRRETAQQAAAAAAAVERQRQQLEQDEAVLRTAEAELERAKQAREARWQLAEDAARRTKEAERAAAEHDERHRAWQLAVDAEAAARRRWSAAEEAWRRAKRHRDAVAAAAQLATTRAELATLSDRANRAEEADDRVRRLDEELSGLRINGDQVDELRQLEARVRTARARLEVGAPRLELTALADLAVSVDGVERTLAAGSAEARAVTGPTVVELPGLLRFEVQPGANLADAERAVDDAERALQARCAEVGVVDVADAADRLERRRQLEQRVHTARADRDRIAGEGGLDRLRARLAQAQAAAAAASAALERHDDPAVAALVDHPDELERAVAASEKAAADADRTRHTAELDLTEATAASKAAEGALGRAAKRCKEADDEADHLERRLEQARQAEADEALTAAFDRAVTVLRTQTDTVQQLRDALDELDPTTTAERARVAADSLEEVEQELHDVEIALSERTGEVKGARDDGRYTHAAETAEAAAAADRHLAAVRRRAEAARLLAEILERHRDHAQTRYARGLVEEVSRLASSVLGTPATVELTSDLAISHVVRGHQRLPFDQLSAGTREQLGVLLRVAAARLVGRADPSTAVPVVLDDALGFADPDRIQTMLATLRAAAADSQLLVLTCHPDRYRGIAPAARVEIRPRHHSRLDGP